MCGRYFLNSNTGTNSGRDYGLQKHLVSNLYIDGSSTNKSSSSELDSMSFLSSYDRISDSNSSESIASVLTSEFTFNMVWFLSWFIYGLAFFLSSSLSDHPFVALAGFEQPQLSIIENIPIFWFYFIFLIYYL